MEKQAYFQQARQYLWQSPKTSMIAGVLALAHIISVFVDLPPGVLEAAQVVAIVLIGLFAKDERRRDGRVGD